MNDDLDKLLERANELENEEKVPTLSSDNLNQVLFDKKWNFLISQFSSRQKEEIWSPKTIFIVYNVIRNYIPDRFCSVHK